MVFIAIIFMILGYIILIYCVSQDIKEYRKNTNKVAGLSNDIKKNTIKSTGMPIASKAFFFKQ